MSHRPPPPNLLLRGITYRGFRDMEYPVSVKMSAVETSSITRVANFAARFCNELDYQENYICSPLSVEMVLALTALGSGEDSRAEIFKALDIPSENYLRSSFTFLTTTLDLQTSTFHLICNRLGMCKLPPLLHTIWPVKNQNATLKMANKIYVKQGDAVKTNLQKDAVEVFKSSLEQIDFENNAVAADTINNWVANQTNNLIKELVSAEMFNKGTGLVLVNAIYFHGFWKSPFEPSDTDSRTFHVNSTKKINIKMMSNYGVAFNFKHALDLKAKILQMFYKGDQASMVIVLPDEVEGLSGVMRAITAGYDLMSEIKCLKATKLEVVMPKFTVETDINLKELLPKMGIKTIFDCIKSDINMLSSNEPLFVSEAIQKAYIAVHEKGTEAAAATLVLVQEICDRLWKGEHFIANHPFLYLLLIKDIPVFFGVFSGNNKSEM